MDRLVPGMVLAFAGGVAAARGTPPAAALGILLAATLLLFVAGRRPSLRPRLPVPFDGRASPVLLALAACLGAARAGVDALPPSPRSLEVLLPAGPVPVLLEGVVEDAPERIGRVPSGAGAGAGPAPSWRLEIAVRALRGDAGALPAEGRVAIFVPGDPGPLLPGDRLLAAGLARAWPGPRNPGGRDRAAEARDRGLVRAVESPGAGSLVLLARGPPSPSRLAARLRRALLAAVDGAFRGEGRALHGALLAGRAADLDPGLVEEFRRTGTWHVMVVSGFHVAAAAAAATWLLGRLGAGLRVRAAGALAAGAAYAGATGFGVPALRALGATALLAVAPAVRRRAEGLHALFVAAGVLLWLRPAVLAEPGFQLSFAAVLGILRLGPGIGDLLFARRRFLRRFPIPAADRSLRRRAGDLLEILLPPTLAAWLATTPILVHHFGSLSPVTPLANLVLVPLATGALVLGAGLLAAGTALPEFTAPCADAVAALLAAAARGFAAIPGGWLPVPPAPAWLLAADGALLAAAAWRPTALRLRLAAAGMAALAVLPHLAPPRPGAPAAVVLDAGHGQAVLADAGTARVLVDAGGRSPRVGAGAILPALRARGVGALEALALSHEDADHCGAAAEVLAALPVGLLVVGEGFGAGATGRGVLAAAAERGVPVARAAGGDGWTFEGLRFEVLHPPRGAAGFSDNDGSLVVRVAMEGLTLLCPGDLETAGVASLLASGEDLRADVLLLPHHGSPGVRGVEVLAAATGATTLVVSAGPGTVRVDRVGAPAVPALRSTAEEGAIVIGPGER